MISEKHTKRFCKEDISKIENYDKAINDKTQTWHCHHKAEILPCGRFSRNDLKKFDLYWNRPSNELIFLPKAEHTRMHNIGIKKWLGKHHSEETKRKMSEKKKGYTPWNKGKKGVQKCSLETKKKISEARKLYWEKQRQLKTKKVNGVEL